MGHLRIPISAFIQRPDRMNLVGFIPPMERGLVGEWAVDYWAHWNATERKFELCNQKNHNQPCHYCIYQKTQSGIVETSSVLAPLRPRHRVVYYVWDWEEKNVKYLDVPHYPFHRPLMEMVNQEPLWDIRVYNNYIHPVGFSINRGTMGTIRYTFHRPYLLMVPRNLRVDPVAQDFVNKHPLREYIPGLLPGAVVTQTTPPTTPTLRKRRLER